MAETHPKLKRTVGLVALTLYGVGDILGAGVYGLVGKAAGQMGSAVWLAYFMSMIAAGLTGLSYASLGSRYPKAAGASFAAFRAYKSSFVSYVVGLAVLCSGLTSMAAGARAFAGYFGGFFAEIAPSVSFIAIIFSLCIAAVVFWGIRESLFANGICTLIELSGLILVLVVGVSFLGSVNYLDATTLSNPTGDITLSLILGGAVLTFYSFVGFEDILNISEEVKNPRYTLPRGLILAVLISSLIYMGISLVAVSVISPQELADSKQPLVDVVARAAPWFPASLFRVIALFAVANTALLNFIMGSRLLYGMANQGLIPQGMGRVHPKRHTPYIAILVVWFLFLILILSGDISTLARSTSVLLLLCFVVVNSALVILKRREKIPGSFEVPFIIPVLGVLVCAAMLSQAKTAELITAGSLLAGIVVLYFVKRPSEEAVQRLSELDV